MSKVTEHVKKEGAFSAFPVLPSERIWGFLDFSLINIGIAVATWGFLIGGTLSLFVGLKMGITASIAGNTVAIILMALATSIPSSKYGIDQYITLRSVFGSKGVRIVMALVVIVIVGWITLLSIMFGKASSNVYHTLTNTVSDSNFIVIFFSFIALMVSWLIVAKGPVSINWLNRIVSPGLIIMLIVMVYLILGRFTITELFALEPIDPSPNDWWNYIIAFELSLGAGLSWWNILGGLSRLTKTQRVAFWPNMIGINFAAVLATVVGLAAGLALGSSDPTEWMVPIGGPILGVIALLFIAFANITSITALIYPISLALKQFNLFSNLGWGKQTFILVLPSIIFILFPDAIYDNFSTFLAACGTIYGPLSVIYFVDYFILRKQQLNIRGLYVLDSADPYYFWNGYNIAALISFIVSTALYFVILNPITFASSTIFNLFTATIPVVIVGGISYYILSKTIVIPKGYGNYEFKDAMNRRKVG